MFNFSNFSNLFTPNMFGNSFVSGFSINSFGSNPSYSGFGASNSIYSTFSNCGYTNTNNGYVGYQVGSAVMSVLSLGATALLNKKMTENSSQSANTQQIDKLEDAISTELNKISIDATISDYNQYDIEQEPEYKKLAENCTQLQADLGTTMEELTAAENANPVNQSQINALSEKRDEINSKIKKANEDLKAYKEKREQEIENAQTKIRELLEQKAVLEIQSIRNEAVKNNGCILTRAPKKDVAAKYENANYEGTVTLSELRTATNEYAKACKKGDVESREKWAKVLRNMKKVDVDNIAEGNSAYKSLAALRDQAEAWLNH